MSRYTDAEQEPDHFARCQSQGRWDILLSVGIDPEQMDRIFFGFSLPSRNAEPDKPNKGRI